MIPRADSQGSFHIDTSSAEAMLEWLDAAGFRAHVDCDGAGLWHFGLAAGAGPFFHQATGACLRDGVRDMLTAAQQRV